MKKFIKKKTTETRKKKQIDRLYLIGKDYEDAGFTKETVFSYDIDFENKKVKISKDKSKFSFGRGKVCAKKINGEDVPLMDINNNGIKEVFKNIKKCNVEIYKDEIIITPYEENVVETSSIASGLGKVINFFSKKKAKVKYRLSMSDAALVMKKAVGLEQISFEELGFSFSEDIETQTHVEAINKSENLKNIIDMSLSATILSGYKYFDVFTGSGIAGMALEKHGFETIGYSEVDKYAIQNYEANFPGRKNYGDITKIDTKELEDFDIMVGGSPCQQFSLLSKVWNEDKKVQGLDGKDSSLFYEYVRILNAKKPKWFIYENVNGIKSANEKKDFEIIINSLSEHYNVEWSLMNSSDYGVPQTRRRVYIVGQRKDLGEFNFTFPKKKVLKTVAQELLEKNVDSKYYLTEKMRETVLKTGTKGWYAKPETDLAVARPLTATMAKMHRASQDNYYTMDNAPEGKTNLRRLTPREAARLQGLGDDYKIVVSDAQAYKIMGNAMTYNVVEAIVNKLAKYISKVFGADKQNFQFA